MSSLLWVKGGILTTKAKKELGYYILFLCILWAVGVLVPVILKIAMVLTVMSIWVVAGLVGLLFISGD
ncbi:hypothetical protein LCGC14_0995210 [marine sediment metagenome]|uniref:Uncharacterized protein n=1 Tax=marine sediment metagenome TaxID=412755 RepID=A0A0F9RAX2_9ZZZZ